MNPERDGFFGIDSDGIAVFVAPLVGASYRRKDWKKVDVRQAAHLVRKHLQPKPHNDAMAEAWLRLVFYNAKKTSVKKANAEPVIAFMAGWAATRVNLRHCAVLRKALLHEHQTWTQYEKEALLSDLLEHMSDLDALSTDGATFPLIPSKLAKVLQSELRRSNAEVLVSELQPLGNESVRAIEDTYVSKEPGPEELLMQRESEVAVFVEAAGLGPQERELMQALLNNPDLLAYGGNKKIADALHWSTQQVGIVKKRALDKMRQVAKQQSA